MKNIQLSDMKCGLNSEFMCNNGYDTFLELCEVLKCYKSPIKIVVTKVNKNIKKKKSRASECVIFVAGNGFQ